MELDDDLRVWTTAEVARFLDAVEDHDLRGVWHLAVGTGARRGELLGLRWRDVDLDAGTVTIRRSLTIADGVVRLPGTKTSRSRTLGIGPTVVAALRRERERQQACRRGAADQWHDRWGLVFTDGHGQPVQPMRVTREFRRLVPGWTVMRRPNSMPRSTRPGTAGQLMSSPQRRHHRDTLESGACICYRLGMRTSVTFDDELVAEARELHINLSEAAREGLRAAIRRRRAASDRDAYQASPEAVDADWDDAEAWGSS